MFLSINSPFASSSQPCVRTSSNGVTGEHGGKPSQRAVVEMINIRERIFHELPLLVQVSVNEADPTTRPMD